MITGRRKWQTDPKPRWIIRNKLQIILSRAELRKDTSQCESCAIAVSEIVNEIRDLEAFVRAALRK